MPYCGDPPEDPQPPSVQSSPMSIRRMSLSQAEAAADTDHSAGSDAFASTPPTDSSSSPHPLSGNPPPERRRSSIIHVPSNQIRQLQLAAAASSQGTSRSGPAAAGHHRERPLSLKARRASLQFSPASGTSQPNLKLQTKPTTGASSSSSAAKRFNKAASLAAGYLDLPETNHPLFSSDDELFNSPDPEGKSSVSLFSLSGSSCSDMETITNTRSNSSLLPNITIHHALSETYHIQHAQPLQLEEEQPVLKSNASSTTSLSSLCNNCAGSGILSKRSSASGASSGCLSASVVQPTPSPFSTNSYRRSVNARKPSRGMLDDEGFLVGMRDAWCDDDTWQPSNRRRSSEFALAHAAAKHLTTDQVMAKHGYKTKLSRYQEYMDRAFGMIQTGSDAIALQGVDMLAKIMSRAWTDPKFGHDLAYDLCDYLYETGYLVYLLQEYTNNDDENMELAAGAALEECFSAPNRELMVNSMYLDPLLRHFDNIVAGERMRISLSILENLFKQSVQGCTRVIELGGLDHVLKACKTCTNPNSMRHAAVALSNLAMFGGCENHPQLICRNVPEWLFLLASLTDAITRYYACLAICMLVSNPEIEAAVLKSGTLGLVEPFLMSHKPEEFAKSCDYKHQQGKPRAWLEKLLPLFTSKRREARGLAAFHFCMEATIKKQQERLEVFQEINAIPLLKELASSPDELASKFATSALQTIGETVPYKLSEDVPLWSVEDVKFWVTKIGFAKYSDAFESQMVDGDILLLMTEDELREDIEMKSSPLRKRFIRELKALKIGAHYGCVDETHLDKFMISISPAFSVYTYRMLEAGVDRQTLTKLTDEMLKVDCRIKNGIHRKKILEALEDVDHLEDMEIAILRKNVDVFISYRRSTGSQLASLIRVLLQLRGYKVFIDVDRLYAGQFDSSLLMNIRAAKHFVLVLTPQSLDRCVGDFGCDDWIHKEVKCALDNNRNIIPVLQNFNFPPDEQMLPEPMRAIMKFNSIPWVHEYQEACVDKMEKFIKGELNVQQRQLAVQPAAPGRSNSITALNAAGGLRSISEVASP